MSYHDAIKYLESFVNYEKIPKYPYSESFKFQRIKEFLKLLRNPQDSVRSIHIAGSKGKSSTSAMVAYVLRAAGFNVGLYTSPHLVSFRERIRLLKPIAHSLQPMAHQEFEGMIEEDEVVELVEYLKPYITEFSKTSKWEALSFFEIYTALTFVYFKRKKVDFTVLETGLGGRLDATNTVNPLVCAITPIGLEHVDKLGNTLSDIAYEKAGIIKKKSLVIVAPQPLEVMKVIEKTCREKLAKLYRIDKDINYNNIYFKDNLQIFDVKGIADYRDVKISLLGPHQIENATLAIGIVKLLLHEGVDVKEDSIKKGLLDARWPGRLEVISDKPLVVLDGAQTVESAAALVNSVKRFFKYKRIILVLGMSNDKNIEGFCSQIKNLADNFILTKANIIRAKDPKIMAQYLNGKNYVITDTVRGALESAMDLYQNGDLILVTGSLFVVGEARQIVNSDG